MKRFSNRRFLSISTAVALVFLLSVTAVFAAWPSFQNTNANNGVITVPTGGTAPPTATGTAARPTTLPSTSAWLGVEVPPVIGADGYAYTLHNGGTQGALLEKTDLANPVTTATPYVVLNSAAQNVQQLSTPYINGSTLYTLVATAPTIYTSSNFDGWKTDGGATVSGGTVTFPENDDEAGITSEVGELYLANAVTTLLVQTDLNPTVATDSGDYSVTLTGPASVTLVPSTNFTGEYGTYYTYEGTVPPGSYTVRLSVAKTTGTSTATYITIGTYRWQLFSVNTTLAPGQTPTLITSGQGQPNTPISYDGSGNIYWGVWGGDKSYFQLDVGSGSTTPLPFAPGGGDNFYWAGAAFVTIDNTDYVVFGSDSGTMYIRPVIGFGDVSPAPDPGFTKTIDQTLFPNDKIRSSVAVKGDYVYFTSTWAQSTPTANYTGELWQVAVSSLTTSGTLSTGYVTLTNASTSTPVISNNNYVYVGTYNGFTSGTVEAFPVSNFITGAKIPIYPASGTGDPVQSSPIAYTGAPWDYVYFTTNASGGSGYCYRFNGTTVQSRWTAANTSGNNYSLQGMAYADNGYVVWGDDGNNLYIAP
ncbi:MAG: hypothetical protein LBS24_06080 [Clostridiales Family XIII bacterium]|jgi:hypothetical protein|nr:hypothetical protein [Clostridiales Family XIII bacterium]